MGGVGWHPEICPGPQALFEEEMSMANTDFAYIASKVAHMQRFGIPAGYNERTGAAQPVWRKEIIEEETLRQNPSVAVRALRAAREAAEQARRAKRHQQAPEKIDLEQHRVASRPSA